MRLVAVELTRLRWRRAVIVLLIGCVVVPAVLFAGLAWNTRPVSDDELRRAEQQIAREAAEPWVQDEIRACVADPKMYGVDPAIAEAECPEMLAPQLEWYLIRPQLDVGEQRGGTGFAVITILVALVMLIGTTFAGHDWNSGSMSNQLLFEPRRLRVWTAKGVAVLLTGLVTAAVVLAAWWGAVWLIAEQRGVQASAATWELIGNSALRGAGLVSLAGLGGYALTMLFRSTVAALGVLFATSIAGSLVIGAVLGTRSVEWLPPTNFMAVVLNGYEYFDERAAMDCLDVGGGCDEMATLTLTHGVLYLGVLLLVAVGLSLWSFRRRDVA